MSHVFLCFSIYLSFISCGTHLPVFWSFPISRSRLDIVCWLTPHCRRVILVFVNHLRPTMLAISHHLLIFYSHTFPIYRSCASDTTKWRSVKSLRHKLLRCTICCLKSLFLICTPGIYSRDVCIWWLRKRKYLKIQPKFKLSNPQPPKTESQKNKFNFLTVEEKRALSISPSTKGVVSFRSCWKSRSGELIFLYEW